VTLDPTIQKFRNLNSDRFFAKTDRNIFALKASLQEPLSGFFTSQQRIEAAAANFLARSL
jgi:hypothetical protein